MRQLFCSRRTSLAPLLSTVGLLLFLLCQTTACLALPFPLSAQSTSSSTAEEQAPAPERQAVTDKNLADLIPKATQLSKKLLEMRATLSGLESSGGVEDGLQAVSEKRNRLQEQLHTLQINPKGKYQELAELHNLMQVADLNAAAVSRKLDASIAAFDIWIDFWGAEEKKLPLWEEGLGASSSLPAVQKVLKQLQDTVDQANQTINEELVPLLTLQKKGGELNVKLKLIFALLVFTTLFITLFTGRHSLKRSGHCCFSCNRPAAVSMFISLLFFQEITQLDRKEIYDPTIYV